MYAEVAQLLLESEWQKEGLSNPKAQVQILDEQCDSMQNDILQDPPQAAISSPGRSPDVSNIRVLYNEERQVMSMNTDELKETTGLHSPIALSN
jgi:hypothetical protein